MEKEKVEQLLENYEDETRYAIPILTNLTKLSNEYRDKLERDYPQWKTNDSRLTCFSKISNSINAATLSYVSFLEYFLSFDKGSFWYRVKKETEEIKEDFTEENLLIHLLSLKQSSLFSLFHQVFSSAESSLRIFLREQTLIFGQKATEDFQQVFEKHLYEVCGFNKNKADEYWDLLHILSTIRNCIHNNGVYIHKSPGEYTIEYNRGGIKEFNFQQGKSCKIQWDEQKVLFTHLLEMLNDIIRSEAISEQEKMLDPVPTDLFNFL
jgi:hypothetical protein